MNATIEPVERADADAVLDRWLVDQHEFDLPCDADPAHGPADWIRKCRTCVCSILLCEPCRAHYFERAPKAHWPRKCVLCGAQVATADLIFFVPLREAPVT